MSEFKELSKPKVEEGKSIDAGKWFVFVNNAYGKYTSIDDDNFLHKSGRKLCELRKDAENGRIMFDTELDAFTKSVEFYALHKKIYPWAEAYGNCLGAEYSGACASDSESQTMRFD